MELDDFRQAWQQLDQRLAEQGALQWALLRESKLARARRQLWQLGGWQLLQILLGIGLIGWSLPFWVRHLDHPSVVLAGAAISLYGYGLIGIAALLLSRILRIDYAAPVLRIQQQLLQLEQSYRRSQPWLGHPWWLLWLACVVLLIAQATATPDGRLADLAELRPGWLLLNLGVAAVALLVTLAVRRWLKRGGHPRLSSYLAQRDGVAIRRAQAELEQLSRFGRD